MGALMGVQVIDKSILAFPNLRQSGLAARL